MKIKNFFYKMRYAKQHSELKLIVAEGELRQYQDPYDKAVHIILNYVGDVKLTQRGICQYFDLDRKRLKRRVWQHLIGFNHEVTTKQPYLAPKHEADLAGIIDISHKKLDSKTIDEVLNMVSKIFHI